MSDLDDGNEIGDRSAGQSAALSAPYGLTVDADTGELIPREIDGFIIHQRAKDGYRSQGNLGIQGT